MLSPPSQRLHWPAHHLPHEEPSQQSNQQQRTGRVDLHAAATFRQLQVGRCQRQICIQNAQYLLLRRMRMASGVRARRLIFNWSNYAQYAISAATAVNSESIRSIQARQWLGLCMASVTCLSRFIDSLVLFGGVSCVRDPPVLIEDPDLFNARLGGHSLDRAVESFSIIPQHVIVRAVLDYIADALGSQQCILLQML